MRRFRDVFLLVFISAGLGLAWALAQGQLGGLKNKLKKKPEDTANKKTDEAIDKATGEGKANSRRVELVKLWG